MQATLFKEYGVSIPTLTRCIKQYSTTQTDNVEVFTYKPVKDLQIRNALLYGKLFIPQKQLPYLRQNRTTIRCCSYASFSVGHKDSLHYVRCQQKHILQEFPLYTCLPSNDNQEIAKRFLQIYADYNKQLDAY